MYDDLFKDSNQQDVVSIREPTAKAQRLDSDEDISDEEESAKSFDEEFENYLKCGKNPDII